MTKLKCVIIEMDYHTLEQKNDADYFRLPWYYRYYGVQIGPMTIAKKLSLYYSNPSFFNNFVRSSLKPGEYKYIINEFGFVENDFPGTFDDLQYDSIKIASGSKERLFSIQAKSSPANLPFNKGKINAIVKFCRENAIRVVMISTPAFRTYVVNQDKARKERRNQFIDSLRHSSGIVFYDFESDPRFNVHDFKNDDHLNSAGAQKFSEYLNILLLQITRGA